MPNLSPLTTEEFAELAGQAAFLLHTAQTPVVVPGEAALGLEAMAAGAAAPGRRILNVVTGPYGCNFGVWLARGGAEVVNVAAPFDTVVSAEEVETAVERSRPCALALVQAEAATGGSNPARALLEIARRHGLVTLVDAVSAVGAEPVEMDAWGMDLVAIGAQKALAGPNGVSFVGVSARGWRFLAENPRAPRNSILSLLDLRPSPGAPVPPNIPVLEARDFLRAMRAVRQEGLDALCRRHRRAAASALAGLRTLGVSPWQKTEAGRSPLVTTVYVPDGLPASLSAPDGIVAPGDGELRGRLWRLNHYGADAAEGPVTAAMRTLARLTGQSPVRAVAAVREVWLS